MHHSRPPSPRQHAHTLGSWAPLPLKSTFTPCVAQAKFWTSGETFTPSWGECWGTITLCQAPRQGLSCLFSSHLDNHPLRSCFTSAQFSDEKTKAQSTKSHSSEGDEHEPRLTPSQTSTSHPQPGSPACPSIHPLLRCHTWNLRQFVLNTH